MAFTYTRKFNVFGNKKLVCGNYTSNSGSTGGEIVTGLQQIDAVTFSVATSTPSTVATISGGTVTITTTANQTGTWQAIGV
jgi:hypothetical protein